MVLAEVGRSAAEAEQGRLQASAPGVQWPVEAPAADEAGLG